MDQPNHNGVVEIRIVNLARLAQLTADGTQWEGRVHMVGHFPDGDHMMGEVVIRSFEGGLKTIDELVANGLKMLHNALVQQRTGLVLPIK